MNRSKLAAMPNQKIDDACMVHAEKALGYKQSGNKRMYRAHARLLDQCANILRAKLGKPPLRRGSSAKVVCAAE